MRNKFLQLVQVFKFCLFHIFSLLLLICASSSSIRRIWANSASQWTKNFAAFFITIWRSVSKNNASIWLRLGIKRLILIHKVGILYIVQFVLTKLVFSLLHLKVGKKWVFCWAYSPKYDEKTQITYLTIYIYGLPTTTVWCKLPPLWLCIPASAVETLLWSMCVPPITRSLSCLEWLGPGCLLGF